MIEKWGTPRAVLLSIRDYVRLAAPEPEVLKLIGEESKVKGTDSLTPQQIVKLIRATRAKKSKHGLLAYGWWCILVSAAIKPDGLQRTVFLLAITKPARLYVSSAILSEYREVLARPAMLRVKGVRCFRTAMDGRR